MSQPRTTTTITGSLEVLTNLLNQEIITTAEVVTSPIDMHKSTILLTRLPRMELLVLRFEILPRPMNPPGDLQHRMTRHLMITPDSTWSFDWVRDMID